MSKKTKAIICVDDEKMVLSSLKEQLSQHFGQDFVIEIAESGDEALEILDFLSEKGVSTQAIISDWLMPEMKGDELLVKVHHKFPTMAKIMLSGQADKAAVDNAVKNAKLQKFISKPWKREDLVQTLEKAGLSR